MFVNSVVSIHCVVRGLCSCKLSVQVPRIARWVPATARLSCFITSSRLLMLLPMMTMTMVFWDETGEWMWLRRRSRTTWRYSASATVCLDRVRSGPAGEWFLHSTRWEAFWRTSTTALPKYVLAPSTCCILYKFSLKFNSHLQRDHTGKTRDRGLNRPKLARVSQIYPVLVCCVRQKNLEVINVRDIPWAFVKTSKQLGI